MFIQAENANIHMAVGETERLRLHLDAQYYLTLVAKKRDERVARRDFWMEVGVIVLIGVEIILSAIFGLLGITEGRQQSRVLEHMDQSTAATAKTVGDLQKAQIDSLQTLRDSLGAINTLNTEITKQTVLLGATQENLRAQLNLASRQFEEQNKHPVFQVRAVLYHPGTNLVTTQVLQPHKGI